MAEGGEKLTGLAKHFNSTTMYGRANVSDLTSKSRRHRRRLNEHFRRVSFILKWIFERLINFSGNEGDVCRYGTDRSVLLRETEEQKDVVYE